MDLPAAENSARKSDVSAEYAGQVFPKLWDFLIEPRPKPHFVASNCDGRAKQVELIGESGDLHCDRSPKFQAYYLPDEWIARAMNNQVDVHAVNELSSSTIGVSMDQPVLRDSCEDERLVLDSQNSVDNGAQSQRRITEGLGITLGSRQRLPEAACKCDLIKVSQAPAGLNVAERRKPRH
jgi:hypothetical protein